MVCTYAYSATQGLLVCHLTTIAMSASKTIIENHVLEIKNLLKCKH